jgi:phage virion morphogenesis protein
MAGTYIKLDASQVQALARRLASVALSSAEQTQLMANLGAEIEDQTKERFETKRDPEGNPWKDIAESTKEWYSHEFPGAEPPLVREGGLRDSVESRTRGPWAVLVGATKEYAAVHQWGWEARGIEARPYLGLGPQDLAALEAKVVEFLQANWGAA